ncbi:MAG: tRNA (adenosine(37)-N6)-threonylcarbamoyltransferase complex transferase subunit TsaD [Oscillospiraceae bacterium]|nr:tRNA (adenosine(37)-N6)-threonylcarbamoyltransferase complex transferase subunit TsaD [Oscillospiraceae bacterium]
MLILGIESSCDETSAAVVKDGREVLSNIILSQTETHAKYGGVVPEIASRAHTEAICPICSRALTQAGVNLSDIDIIAATNTPGLIGALLVGLSFAKSLAYKLNLPFVPVNHIKGHIAAAYLEYPGLEPPFLAFVASGGHTSIMDIRDYLDHQTLGATRDDALGEAFDKIARAMGLSYPGGAEIERYAKSGGSSAVKIPLAKVEGHELDFSFSGVKTYVINHINTLIQKNGGLSEKDRCDIAASLTGNAVKSASVRIKRALELTGHKKLVCAGGVLANSHICAALKELCGELNTELYIPDKKYCGDNAAMIAAQAYYEYKMGSLN